VPSRFHLVFTLDEETGRLIEHEGLRHAALVVWFRELTLRESLLDMGTKVAVLAEAERLPSLWGHWDAALTESLVGLHATGMARERLEQRYLGGQTSLFPERAGAWQALVDQVRGLHELGRGFEDHAGRHTDKPLASQETITSAAEVRADEVAERIVVRAMSGAHQSVGDTRETERIATQQIRARVS
jgi:hypothetical protein